MFKRFGGKNKVNRSSFRRLMLLVGSVLILASCTSLPDLSSTVSPLPVPTIEPSTPGKQALSREPNREQGYAQVVGTLLVGENGASRPVTGVPLYLGTIITTSDGQPLLVSLDKSTAPKAISDDEGHFIFGQVPAGKYAIILDVVIQTVVLRDPVKDSDLIIDAKPGMEIDLGELTYPKLPIP